MTYLDRAAGAAEPAATGPLLWSLSSAAGQRARCGCAGPQPRAATGKGGGAGGPSRWSLKPAPSALYLMPFIVPGEERSPARGVTGNLSLGVDVVAEGTSEKGWPRPTGLS